MNFSLKFLVTGINGQLGYDIVRRLKGLNFDVIATGRDEFDFTDKVQTSTFILKEKPDVIIHCAAYTAVDKAEDEKDLCYSVNVDGTKNIVEAAKTVNATLVYVSTDYVFDGEGNKPYYENKETKPINYYGYTKELGEQIVKNSINNYFIVRTSWVYGTNGNNFVKTMLKLAETKDEISVVNDQIGAPTYTIDLAEFIINLVQTDKYGIYHGVNEGFCSWYDFAKAIFEKSKIDIKVNPITTSAYPTKAKRPKNSRLSKDNTDTAALDRLPDWKDALSRFLAEIK
ncbi:dTDP-4-dehydrorhamnose reductase [Alkalibaculum bacchi]|uniref:dTDP-4-dehydrorhamnose reductase n=1 Tax=Alkalibaculum bacchi TaxID=645887 RepID=UPI00350E3D7C